MQDALTIPLHFDTRDRSKLQAQYDWCVANGVDLGFVGLVEKALRSTENRLPVNVKCADAFEAHELADVMASKLGIRRPRVGG